MLKNQIFAGCVGLMLLIANLSGGGFMDPSKSTALIAGTGFVIMVWALWRLRLGLPNRSAYFALLVFCIGVVVMLAQLIPLPINVWSSLPGRSFLSKDFADAGVSAQSLPFSLSPYATKQDILFLLPAFAGFLAVASLPTQNWRVIIWTLVGLAMASAILGLMQRFQGSGGAFDFFHRENPVPGSAFFSNRNNLGSLLYCTVPLAAALIFPNFKSRTLLAKLLWAILFVGILFVTIAGVGSTGSRMGTLLLFAAMLSLPFLFFSSRNAVSSRSMRPSIYSVVGIFVAVVAFAQLSLTALQRFVSLDAASDYRGTMFDVSLKTLKAFFPAGSGFGSFVPAS